MLTLNRDYFAAQPLDRREVPRPPATRAADVSSKVAVVGAGPAACYVAEHLVGVRGIELVLFERLHTPFGLIRHGIAPDHLDAKAMAETFAITLARPNVTCLFGVEVGRDVTVDELRASFDAVIWAGGLDADRRLAIPGEALRGVHAARDLVGWYNGHPDSADADIDCGERVLVIGNGNVALDVARILALSRDELLHGTDASSRAIAELARRERRTVSVVGRRGPAQAAYSLGELAALVHHPRLTVRTDGRDLARDDPVDAPLGARHALLPAASGDPYGPATTSSIVLRYLLAPVRINGSDRVESVTFEQQALRTVDGRRVPYGIGRYETIRADLVVRSIGHVGRAFGGLPRDPDSGTVRNVDGRVTQDDGSAMRGVYVAGWAKRGAEGVLGANRLCAAQTVAAVLDDLQRGSPPSVPRTPTALLQRIRQRQPHVSSLAGWDQVNQREITTGREQGRPRETLTTWDELRLAVGDR
jgi:ferredoxin--NADP+ reductase